MVRMWIVLMTTLVMACGDTRAVEGNDSQLAPDGGGADDLLLRSDNLDPDGNVTCPATLPVAGTACSGGACSYSQSGGCPCGPATIWWKCHCTQGTWSCLPSDHCHPCGLDAGPDISLDWGPFPCPPAPSCNWCGGNTLFDRKGCVLGYTCANGVDPCVTQPCFSAADCKPFETCGPDMLCWPTKLDAGGAP